MAQSFKQLKSQFGNVDKSITFCYGRFNPPTSGHKVLIDKMKTFKTEQKVFMSPTHDSKKNPLCFESKLYYMQEMFPDVETSPVVFSSLWEVLQHLSDTGYKNVNLVCGGDRTDKYKTTFSKYLGKELQFETFNVINAGDRDPDFDGNLKGISSTLIREAAKQGDFESFISMTPQIFDKTIGFEMMNEVRQEMGLNPLFENNPIMGFVRRDAPNLVNDIGEDEGLYSAYSVKLDDGVDLYNWAVKNHIPNIVDPTEMHCTVIYSPKNVPEYKSVVEYYKDQVIGLDPSTYSLQVLGGALVLRFFNQTLQDFWNFAKKHGADFTFPSYKQHITISYDIEGFDYKKLTPPNFGIVLVKPFINTLKEMHQFDLPPNLIKAVRHILEDQDESEIDSSFDANPDNKRFQNANAKYKSKKKEDIIIDPVIPSPLNPQDTDVE